MKDLNSDLFAKFEKSRLSNIASVVGGAQKSDYNSGSLGQDYDKKSTGADDSDWRDSSLNEDSVK